MRAAKDPTVSVLGCASMKGLVLWRHGIGGP